MFIKSTTLASLVLVTASQSASAVIIDFDYSFDGGFFSGTNISRRTPLEAAGSYLGSILADSLAPITSTSNLHFNINFSDPGSNTPNTISLNSYSVAADTLKVFVGGRALGGNTLGFGGPGGYDATASGPGGTAFFDTIRQRGQAGYTENDLAKNQVATDFAPWGGQITFDSDTSWDFDLDPSNITGNDFYSVALHELAHILGFGNAPSWKNQATSGGFTGSNAVAAFGGNVPLTGDLVHWQDGTASTVNGTPQETAMDPFIRVGSRKVFTELDLAGLRDIGWDVSVTAVPVPAAAWLFGTALLGFGCTRRKNSDKR